MLLEYLIASLDCERSNDKGKKKKVQAGENERFKRDCQNVTGGSGSGEVERSQFEAEQEVEATISVCETSPSSVCSDEDMHTACVTSSPPVGEHAVPVSVSLSSSLLAFASARVGWADLITLAGVALEAAEPTAACFFLWQLVSKWASILSAAELQQLLPERRRNRTAAAMAACPAISARNQIGAVSRPAP